MPQVIEFAQPDAASSTIRQAPADVPDVSVVVPVFNELDNLGELVDRIHAALAPTGRSFELIVVDDGSRDRSGVLLQQMAVERPWLRPVLLVRN